MLTIKKDSMWDTGSIKRGGSCKILAIETPRRSIEVWVYESPRIPLSQSHQYLPNKATISTQSSWEEKEDEEAKLTKSRIPFKHLKPSTQHNNKNFTHYTREHTWKQHRNQVMDKCTEMKAQKKRQHLLLRADIHVVASLHGTTLMIQRVYKRKNWLNTLKSNICQLEKVCGRKDGNAFKKPLFSFICNKE